MNDSDAQSQKAVHEILSSIRQIISEDVHQEIQNTLSRESKDMSSLVSTKPRPEVLDLTKMIDESGSIINLNQSIDIGPQQKQEEILSHSGYSSSDPETKQGKSTQNFARSEVQGLSSESVLDLYRPLNPNHFQEKPINKMTENISERSLSNDKNPTNNIDPISIPNSEQGSFYNQQKPYDKLLSNERAIQNFNSSENTSNKELSEMQNLDDFKTSITNDSQKEINSDMKDKINTANTSPAWTFDTEAFSKSMPQSTNEILNMTKTMGADTSVQDIILSQDTLQESAAAFAELARATQKATSSKNQPNIENIGGYTVENLMKELLKPLLKEWLDAQLPSLVRALVVEQIAIVLQQLNQKS